MKRFFIISFVIGISIFFLGCSDVDNTKIPECKQQFVGTCIFKADIDKGLVTVLDDGRTLITGQKAEWYDSTNTKLVTGKSIWTGNWLMKKDGNAQLWGTAEILVDGGRGKWELTWTGSRTPTGSGPFVEMQSPFRIECDAVGKSVEGEVVGMEAKWTNTMDFNGDFSTLFYNVEGFIIK